MTARPKKTLLLLFSRQLSIRPSAALPAVSPSADMSHFSAVRLHFLSELKKAFIRTLNLDDEHVIAHGPIPTCFAAIGSALNAKEDVLYTMEEMVNKLSSGIKMEFEVERMEPLFASQEEYDAF